MYEAKESIASPEKKKATVAEFILGKRLSDRILRGVSVGLLLIGARTALDPDFRADMTIGALSTASFEGSLRSPFYSGLANSLILASDIDINLFPPQDPTEGNKKVDLAKNEKYRSVQSQIQEAVTNYQRGGGKVFFKRTTSFKESDFYKQVIDNAIHSPNFTRPDEQNQGWLGFNVNFLYQEVYSHLSSEEQEIIDDNEVDIRSFQSLASPQSGFKDRMEQITGASLGNRNKRNPRDALGTKANRAGKELIKEVKSFIENEVASNNNKPISSAKILEFFLVKNQGDLGMSLTDTNIALKFLSRNSHETGIGTKYMGNEERISVESQIVTWMKSHIRDESSRFDWTKLPEQEVPYYGIWSYVGIANKYDKDVSTVNTIGSEYHRYGIVSQLRYFGPYFIALGTSTRQLVSGDLHGGYKLAVDFEVLSELDELEKFIREFTK